MATAALGLDVAREHRALSAADAQTPVMARVSMPVMPATPDFSIRSASVPWARQLDTRATGRAPRSRRSRPTDSKSSGFTPTLPISGAVIHHDLPAVRGIGQHS